MSDGFSVRIIGADRSRWDVHGHRAGRQGVHIGEGQLQGIYAAPIETNWSETAGGKGAKLRRRRYLPRDLVVGFHVNGEGELIPGQREAALRLALASGAYQYDPNARPAKLIVTSPMSGERWLYVDAREAPELESALDPLELEYMNSIWELRAGQPLWETDDDEAEFSGTSSAHSGVVTLSNPTDMPCDYSVVLTPAKWSIPDVSWSGPMGEVAPGGEHAARQLPVEVEVADEGARLTRDPDKIPATTTTGRNLVARMAGNMLRFSLPAWLPETELPISYTDAPAGGARAEYRLPRRWTAPWGGEWENRLPDEVEGD